MQCFMIVQCFMILIYQQHFVITDLSLHEKERRKKCWDSFDLILFQKKWENKPIPNAGNVA